MKTIIEVNLHDEIKCTCGNNATLDGFHPCNEEGEYMEPTVKWKGHYKCNTCDQLYLQINNKVEKTTTTYKFNMDDFKRAINDTDIVINEFDILEEHGLVYVTFTNSDITYIRAPLRYECKNNCINIHHGDNQKNGFWWDNQINYSNLIRELKKYHKGSVNVSA